ncbi:MAG: FG-GAP-like repeat-containing protein, partial [Planctomycetota bacterium]|nr:FG-GAP-like repeat-containing protein [Planctomycetota bacterium]
MKLTKRQRMRRTVLRTHHDGRRRRLFERLEERLLLTGPGWQNPDNAFDVDTSGLVTPLDVLISIVALNNRGTVTLPTRDASDTSSPYYDVTGDGIHSPLDVLTIISVLNTDDRPPVISARLVNDTAVGPPNDDGITSDARIAGTTSDLTGVASLIAQLDGGAALPVSFDRQGRFTFDPGLARDGSADGVHRLELFAQDACGNTTQAFAVGFTLDTTPPVVTVSRLVIRNAKPTLSGAVSDATPTSGVAEVSVVVGGQTLTATVNGGTWSVLVPTALPDGTYNVAATATDAVGNTASDGTSNELTVDTTAPLTVTDTTPSLATGGTLEAGTTSLHVNFSFPVLGADLAANYRLQSLGPDALLGTADDMLLPLSVTSSGTTATLHFTALPESVYRLTVRDTITDAVGQLDGDENGAPGGDWQEEFVAVPPMRGLFASGAAYPTDSYASPQSIVAADFNGDGIFDLVTAGYASDNVTLSFSDGTGRFVAVGTFPTGGSSARSVTVGDFNGDGNSDLAVANYSSNNVSVLLGNGAGGFANAVTYDSGGLLPRSVTVGDFNADGHSDLAVANSGSNNVGVLLGNGSGGFAPVVTYDSGG